MRIALIADIHGNVLALEAVLADIHRQAPDLIVNLGDCLSGPLWPEETAALLRDLDWPTVRGNHDRVVAAGGIPAENRTDSYTHDCLSAESLAWLAALPPRMLLPEGILLCHGTPHDDAVYLTEQVGQSGPAAADEALITERLGGEAAPIIICGHSHIPRLVRLSGTGQVMVNPGSVGLQAYSDETPRPHNMETGSPHARYALIDMDDGPRSLSQRAITYDWDRAADRAVSLGRPDWAHALRTGRMAAAA